MMEAPRGNSGAVASPLARDVTLRVPAHEVRHLHPQNTQIVGPEPQTFRATTSWDTVN